MRRNLLHDIKHCECEELYKRYKICVNSDGSVYDTKKKDTYKNLIEWATHALDSIYDAGIIAS